MPVGQAVSIPILLGTACNCLNTLAVSPEQSVPCFPGSGPARAGFQGQRLGGRRRGTAGFSAPGQDRVKGHPGAV